MYVCIFRFDEPTHYLLDYNKLRLIILFMSSGTYILKSAPIVIFLINFSWQFYLPSEFMLEICWKAVSEVIYFHILFWCPTWALRGLHFEVGPKHHIFDKLFMTILLTLRVYARNLLKDGVRSNIFSYFVLFKIPELGFEPQSLT